MKRGDQYVYRLPNDALFEQNFMLQPSENRNINYDPHFNDPSKQTKKQIIEHEKIQFRFNTSVYSILAPDQVRFYPMLDVGDYSLRRLLTTHIRTLINHFSSRMVAKKLVIDYLRTALIMASLCNRRDTLCLKSEYLMKYVWSNIYEAIGSEWNINHK